MTSVWVCTEPRLGRTGRVFVRTKSDNVERALANFDERFYDESDEAWFSLVEATLPLVSEIKVQLYPSESEPSLYQVFFRIGELSESVFACSLVPMSVVEEHLTRKGWFAENAVLQIAADDSERALLEALRLWVERMWPSIRIPKFHLERGSGV